MIEVEESFIVNKQSARLLQLSSKNVIEEIKKDTDDIVAIATNKRIALGDSITFNKKYKGVVKNIDRANNNSYDVYLFYLNKSSLFLTPFYFSNKAEIFWDKYFCNGYIKYKDKFGIYFLFRYKTSNPLTKEDLDYLNFEKQLCSNPNFVDSYELDGYSLFEFKVSELWEEDISKLIQGKYSNISNEAKELILKFHNPQANNKSIVGGTILKSPERKKEIEHLFGVSLDHDDEFLGTFLFNDPKIENKLLKERMLMHSETYINE